MGKLRQTALILGEEPTEFFYFKSFVLRYNQESRRVYICKSSRGHSERSVRQVGYSGFQLTQSEKEAILWHMGGKRRCPNEQQRKDYFESHPLCYIIHRADYKSIREQRRHHPERRDTRNSI